MKVLVLSDLHLGTKASSAASRLDLLQSACAGFDRVILNGDTLDRCYSDPAEDEQAQNFLALATQKLASRNGPPELLTGNHDPAVSSTHWVYIEESSTLIFHGDTIKDCTHPSKPEEQEMMRHFAQRWKELGGRPSEFVALHQHFREVQLQWLPIVNPYKKSKTLWQYTKSLLFPPRRPFDILQYWWMAPGRALKVAKGFERPLKHIVVGHSHRAGRWKMEGLELYNTGSYMPLSKPFAVTIEGDRVSYMPVDVLVNASKRMAGFAV